MLLGLKKLMAILKFHNKNYYKILNILFCLIPLSYIIGNFAINLNVFLLIVFSLIVYNKKIFETKLLLIDKIILCFFVFALFSGIINTFNSFDDKTQLDQFLGQLNSRSIVAFQKKAAAENKHELSNRMSNLIANRGRSVQESKRESWQKIRQGKRGREE